MPSGTEIAAYEAHNAQLGWRAMCDLVHVVRRGGVPPAAPPTIMLRPGEVQHGDFVVDVSAYYGMDVEYSTGYVWGGGLLFSAASLAASAAINANSKRRAQAKAQAQWRPLGRMPAVITNQRLLLMVDGRWTTYALGAIVSMHPELPNWLVALHFESAAPLLLRGPWVPWMTVVISASLFRQPWPPGFNPPDPVPHAVQHPTGPQPAVGGPPRPAGLPQQRALPPA